MSDLKPPIPIGTKVEPWGVITAIHFSEGERCYFFSDGNSTGLIPSELVEQQIRENKGPQGRE